MNKKLNVAIVAIAAAVFFGACDLDEGGTTPGLVNDLFDATLTPAAEVPPVSAPSSGVSHLTVIDTNTIRVQTLVTAIDSVTQAHIHAGDNTTAGPIMVFLAGPFTGTNAVARRPDGVTTTLSGVLSHVDIIRGVTLFQGLFTFDSLRFRVYNGTAYVNVHTRANPGGEIRGQLVTVP
jgi:hypothetical protein